MEDLTFALDDSGVYDVDPNAENDEDVISIRKSVPIRKMQNTKIKRARPAPPRPRQTPPPPPPPPTPRRPVMVDKTFESFSNPAKMIPEEEDDDQSDDHDQEEDNDDIDDQDDFGGPGAAAFEDNHQYDEPSPGFATIEDEKQDLLYRFHRLEKRGVKAKKFNAYSDVREMRAEYQKIKKDAEVGASLKFSKRILMAAVSATEFLNKRYDPFGVELNGWSETVMENVNDGDYDGVFERLHEKYAGKMNTPPEIELLVSLAGSAAMFHMTSTMFKSVPNLQDIAKQNPELKSAMKNMAEQLMKSQGDINNNAEEKEDTVDQNGRREMKGPSINLSQFGGFMPPPQPARPQSFEPEVRPVAAPVPDSDASSSEESGISVKRVEVSVSEGGARRGRKPKTPATKENTIDI